MDGLDLGLPGEGEDDSTAPSDASVEDLLALYRRACDLSREHIEGHALDEVAAHPQAQPTLRWVLLHLVEETARHAGHADVLRELIDGAVGE